MANESPLLAGICGASVLGRIATGARAGQPVLRVGRNPDAPLVTSSGEGQAHVAGFDLHANVAAPAGDRTRLEHLCRYVLRPPVAQDALELTDQGKVLLTMMRPWHDGTRAILFEPHELIEKLAALIPKPRVNLLLYHGVLGPSARLRSAAVMAGEAPLAGATPGLNPDGSGSAAELDTKRGEVDSDPETAPPRPGDGVDQRPGRSRSEPRPHTPWAELLRRTFEIDVLACPGCGGRLRLLATIEEPEVVRKILSHLGIPTECPEPLPARSPPLTTSFSTLFDIRDG